jgi:tetratricopeptide (TPR) repeat protein
MSGGSAEGTQALAHLALALLRAGRTRRAVRVAGEAARRDPGPLTLRLHAAALREAGRGARSLQSARAALAAAPGDPDAAFSVARSLASAARVDEALAALDDLLGRVPDHGPGLLLSGELLLLRDPGAAERRLRRGCQVQPRNGLVRLRLSDALERLGRDEEAEAARTGGLAMDAGLREAHHARQAARAVGFTGMVVAFGLAVVLWALVGQLDRYRPGLGLGPTLVIGMVVPLLPLLLIGWMAAKLAAAQVDPRDADLEALELAFAFEADSRRIG